MKKKEKTRSKYSILKLGAFLLICVNSIMLVVLFQKFTKK